VVPAAEPSTRRLEPCSGRPNCVCSLVHGARYIEPLAYHGSVTGVLARVRAILQSLPRVRIVESEPDYIHAEARSRIFGFVDDLEFMTDPQQPVVHVRSAARLGYSDFGVNRRRIEAIREQLTRAFADEGKRD
jgi:uncharacterized protein (DUF1499 family)